MKGTRHLLPRAATVARPRRQQHRAGPDADLRQLSERIECHVLPISEFVVKNADCLDWDAFAHAGRRRSGQRTSSARF